MLLEDRKKYILQLLQERSSVTIAELSQSLNLSDVSVRKLLASMQEEKLLKRTWGGAVSASGSLRELEYYENATINLREKKAIARAAYNYIDDGDAIFLDSGSTTIEIVRLIKNGPKRNIMVGTNALNLAVELSQAKDIQIVFIGGEVRHSIMSCVGHLAEEALKSLFFDKGFITGNHFTIEHGFTTPNGAEAKAKQVMMTACKESIVLADYSKFGDDSLSLIAPAQAFDCVITDWRMPDSVLKEYEEAGIKMLIGPEIET